MQFTYVTVLWIVNWFYDKRFCRVAVQSVVDVNLLSVFVRAVACRFVHVVVFVCSHVAAVVVCGV
jgi:hypothetical protein